MILVYEKDPKVASAIASALSADGHEVRQVGSFYDVREDALRLRPVAVLFRVDQNSRGTFGGLLNALDPDIPVVAMGERRYLYGAFAGLRMFGGLAALQGKTVPERFWFIGAPVTPEAARDAVIRAIREASAPVAGAARRRRRFIARTWGALSVGAMVALVAGAVLFMLGHPLLLLTGMVAFLALIGVDHARTVVAALRIGLPPPWWWYAHPLIALFLAASMVLSLVGIRVR